MKVSRTKLMAAVQQSPDAVAVHDKQKWMSIFAERHMVEDPVGSTPHFGGIYDAVSGHRSNGALSRFYDTFIAPNQIVFDVDNDVVCGQHVMRDITINLTMSDTVAAKVPMHLLYEMEREDGQWKVSRLAAHWEFIPMIMQLLKKGLPALPVLSSLTVRMLKLQGIGGTLGFSKAAFNIGRTGKALATDFVAAVNEQHLAGLMPLFDSDKACIEWPTASEAVEPSRFLELYSPGEIVLSKLIASGDILTATATIGKGDTAETGVLLFECNRKTKKISSLRLYVEGE